MKPLIIGDRHEFAIESCISRAYERLGLRALGYFVLHIKGRCYGVKSEEATMLACSFDEIGRRLFKRGSHVSVFSEDPDAKLVASAVYDSIYWPKEQRLQFHNLSLSQISELVHSHRLQWAPDGDEAFDDSSFVLHFDVGNRVRLIAFTLDKDRPYCLDPSSIYDLWLDADKFYSLLKDWRDSFEAEWLAASKSAD